MSAGARVRVLHVDGGRRWGGGQNQVRLLMRELEREGVTQLCLCPAGSPLAARLREEALPHVTVAWARSLSLRAVAAIFEHARRAELVHTHDAHSLQLAIPAALLLRRPIVAARRMSLATRASKWNRAARVIAISGVVRDALLESGVDAARIRLVPSGVDRAELESLRPLEPSLRNRLRIGRETFLVGSIGALVPLKGHALIPEAAARLGGVHWVIIGEGEARGMLEGTIVQHGGQGRVHLPGALPDARRALREFDVFVFTSERDALGTSLLDAMACDIPVLAAAAGGPAEVLAPVHDETGSTLYPPRDAAALAALVERVRHDGELRQRMIAAQRRRLDDFDITRTAAATRAVYDEVPGT